MKRSHNYLSKGTILIILLINLSSCRNNQSNTENVNITKNKVKAKVEKSNVENKFLAIKGDSLNIFLENKTVSIAKDAVTNYNNAYEGIYKIDKDSIKRFFNITMNGILYFTTYEDAGTGYRGFLYAFDLKSKRIFKEQLTGDRYMYSSAGIFIFEKGLIFAMGKPGYYYRKSFFVTPAFIYKVNSNGFKYVKAIYAKGEKTYADTSIIDFYDKNIKTNPRKPLVVPKDWFKE